MKEIIPNIFVVVMPIETHSFEKANFGNALFYKDSLNNICKHKSVSLLGMEILGIASEKEITFDCKNIIRGGIRNLRPGKNNEYVFKDYCSEFPDDLRSWVFPTIKDSFLSFVKSKDIELKPNEKLLVLRKSI